MESVVVEWIAAYASLFVHNWNHYAVQQRNGAYWRVTESLTLPLLAAHLDGRVSLGTYLLDTASTCAFAVFDADSSDGLARLVMLSGELAQQGIPTLLEASRRGGHLWVHFMNRCQGKWYGRGYCPMRKRSVSSSIQNRIGSRRVNQGR